MNGGGHAVGLAITFALHAALGGLIVAKADACGGSGAAEASSFEEAETIEAALAFKKVERKDRQPQKQKKEKYAPVDAPTMATDEAAVPTPPPDKPKLAPREDEVDPASVLKKNRVQDETLSSTGAEELATEGADDGSKEWGTERDAKGDPYVGELVGRVKSGWTVPSLEQGSGTAVGCVRLDAAGKITTRELKTRSSNANLDRSVEEALRAAPDMEAPVPDHLTNLLTVKGLCVNFKL